MIWSQGTYVFECEKSLFEARKNIFEKSSSDVSQLLNTLLSKNVPSNVAQKLSGKKLVLIYEKTSNVDAMFFPPGTRRKSAEEELILTINPGVIETDSYLRIVAHEFFHALHFAHNKEEVSWVREGLAQLFESKVFGGNNFAHIHAGLTSSQFPLESEFDPDSYFPEKYGNSLLFFMYLTSQCSKKDTFFWSLLGEGTKGRETVDLALGKLRSGNEVCTSFETSALWFSLAKMINTYSGTEQSPNTFIMSSRESLLIDPLNEKNILKDTKAFWKNLKPYRPLKLRLETGLKLVAGAPQNVLFFSLQRQYPNKVKQVTEQDMKLLSKDYDIGLVDTGPIAD